MSESKSSKEKTDIYNDQLENLRSYQTIVLWFILLHGYIIVMVENQQDANGQVDSVRRVST